MKQNIIAQSHDELSKLKELCESKMQIRLSAMISDGPNNT